MKKRKKSSVMVETYNPMYDPNYGKEFTICEHGVVHLDGEGCECGGQPTRGARVAAADGRVTA